MHLESHSELKRQFPLHTGIQTYDNLDRFSYPGNPGEGKFEIFNVLNGIKTHKLRDLCVNG